MTNYRETDIEQFERCTISPTYLDPNQCSIGSVTNSIKSSLRGTIKLLSYANHHLIDLRRITTHLLCYTEGGGADEEGEE